MPIVMQMMGQTLSQARQPVQISISTSRIPRYLRGRVSWTGFSIRSGYWMVMGRRIRWEKVMVIPSKIVVTVSIIFLAYSVSALMDPLNVGFKVKLRAGMADLKGHPLREETQDD